MNSTTALLGVCFVGAAAARAVVAAEPWPAETWSQAVNLTQVESGGAAGTNDFYQDLSGAFWNPVTRRLWLVRNGPDNATSKVWALRENAGGTGANAFVVDTRVGAGGVTLRAEWTGFNDSEAITQVDLNSDTVFIMAEAEEVIRQYDLSVYGTRTLVRTWNTLSNLPVSGGSGSEGLAFVPDAYLRAAGFVTPAGALYTSHNGMGGLMFVGHQNGGRVYVFDLNPSSTAFTFVGAYLTGTAETSEVCFDRSTGRLFLMHGDTNTLEVCSLASVASGGERRLVQLAQYDRPPGTTTSTNLEGFAVGSNDDCVAGRRWAFETIDDGGTISLMWFSQFPCVCLANYDGNATLAVQDIFAFLNDWFAGAPATDFNHSGGLEVQDIFDFLTAWFRGC